MLALGVDLANHGGQRHVAKNQAISFRPSQKASSTVTLVLRPPKGD